MLILSDEQDNALVVMVLHFNQNVLWLVDQDVHGFHLKKRI